MAQNAGAHGGKYKAINRLFNASQHEFLRTESGFSPLMGRRMPLTSISGMTPGRIEHRRRRPLPRSILDSGPLPVILPETPHLLAQGEERLLHTLKIFRRPQ